MYNSADKYLQDPLIVDFIEDSAVDLIWFQSHPIEHWHAELGFDWLFNFHGCQGRKEVCDYPNID